MFQHWKKDWYDPIPPRSSRCKPVTYPSQTHPFPPLFCQHPSLVLLVFHSRSSLFPQELHPVDWCLSRSGSPWRRSLCRRWTRLHPARLTSMALISMQSRRKLVAKSLKELEMFIQSYKYLTTSSNSEDPMLWLALIIRVFPLFPCFSL